MKREGKNQASCDRKMTQMTQNLYRPQHMMREPIHPYQMILEWECTPGHPSPPAAFKEGSRLCRLDVMPATILKFRGNGDEATARLLEDTIYKVLSASAIDRQVLLR